MENGGLMGGEVGVVGGNIWAQFEIVCLWASQITSNKFRGMFCCFLLNVADMFSLLLFPLLLLSHTCCGFLF